MCALNVHMGVHIWVSCVSVCTSEPWCARVCMTLCAGGYMGRPPFVGGSVPVFTHSCIFVFMVLPL